MDIDKEKVALLVYKYTGCSERARKAQEEMDAAHREGCSVMDELMEYLDKVNADRKAMEEELARLQKAEVERKDASESAAALHTCGECRYLQMGTKNGRPQGFCMHIGPEPVVDCDDDAVACSKFEPSIATLAASVPVPSLYTHTCGECRYWEEERDGTGTCMHRDCETKKRGEMDLSCLHFAKRTLALVSCLECKHAERVSDDVNTWKCALGAGFAGYVKVECKRFEAL